MNKTLTEEQIRQRDEVFARFDKELPEPYAALAKLRYDPVFQMANKLSEYSPVLHAFDWSQTPEGSDFWSVADLYCREVANKLQPIPAESLAELNATKNNDTPMNDDDYTRAIERIREWAKTLPPEWREVAEWQIRKDLLDPDTSYNHPYLQLRSRLDLYCEIPWPYIYDAQKLKLPPPPVPGWLTALIAEDRAELTMPNDPERTVNVKLPAALDEAIDFAIELIDEELERLRAMPDCVSVRRAIDVAKLHREELMGGAK